jgi:hypothetical protein
VLPRSAFRHRPLAAAVLAATLGLPAGAPGQAPPPGGLAYPIRVATHAVPGPGAEPRDVDMVLGVVAGGQARAYPVSLLWGESAHTLNDELGRTPVAVALCPLAGVAAAFERRSGRDALELGHVSEVRLDTLVLYDARTRSRFGLLTGEAFEGPLEGRRLARLPSLFTTWGRWKALHPETTLHVDPEEAARGFEIDADRVRRIVLAGSGPPRRGDWVLGLEGPRGSAAVVLRGLARERVLNDVLDGEPVVAFLTADLTTALAWSREAGGRTLSFRAVEDRMVDVETGTTWDALTGRALSGALAGRRLSPRPSTTGFWHAWKAHHPTTRVLGLPAE